MTRLKTCDIDTIPENLNKYNSELIEKTGRSLLGIACHACGCKESEISLQMENFRVSVVPVTAGQGIITTFSHTVAAILAYLGLPVSVTGATDTAGVAQAFENNAHGLMMSDDNRFVALNLIRQRVVDNSESTGRGYAAALDLMGGGLKGKSVGVVGCGPVGSAAARWLVHSGAHVVLYDIVPQAARKLRDHLCGSPGNGFGSISVAERDLNTSLAPLRYVIEATPVENAIPDSVLSDDTCIAAPGVPLGISRKGCEKIYSHLIHDKLEIGVAVMAVSMLSPILAKPAENI